MCLKKRGGLGWRSLQRRDELSGGEMRTSSLSSLTGSHKSLICLCTINSILEQVKHFTFHSRCKKSCLLCLISNWELQIETKRKNLVFSYYFMNTIHAHTTLMSKKDGKHPFE